MMKRMVFCAALIAAMAGASAFAGAKQQWCGSQALKRALEPAFSK